MVSEQPYDNYFSARRPFSIWPKSKSQKQADSSEFPVTASESKPSSPDPLPPPVGLPITPKSAAFGTLPSSSKTALVIDARPATPPVNVVLPEGVFFLQKQPKTKAEIDKIRAQNRIVNVKDWFLQISIFIIASLVVTALVAIATHPELSLFDWFRQLGFIN